MFFWSRDRVRSREEWKTWYLHFREDYGYWTWKSDDALWEGVTNHNGNMIQQSHKKVINFIYLFLQGSWLPGLMTYDVGPPRAKSHGFLITWSYVVSWKIKNVISPIPQAQWASILTGWCLMTWGHHSKNHISLSKKFFPFINYSLP